MQGGRKLPWPWLQPHVCCCEDCAHASAAAGCSQADIFQYAVHTLCAAKMRTFYACLTAWHARQRGDAEMAQKLWRVVRACVELGPNNPIQQIHDQGAGGNCNVVRPLADCLFSLMSLISKPSWLYLWLHQIVLCGMPCSQLQTGLSVT